eukprot:scaffold201504_cov19-Tisochrysis_lutea.AAC.1
MEDVLNSPPGGRLTRALSYCGDMSLTGGCKLMDPNDSKAHQGLHYAGYEGAEVCWRAGTDCKSTGKARDYGSTDNAK